MSRHLAKRVKTRWSPQNPRGAQSLLDQMEKAILRGKVSNDSVSTPITTVNLPIHVANYLLDAIWMIRGGVDANAALHLVAGKRGRKSNSDRDKLIAIRIRERMEIDAESKETATREIGQRFALSDDGAKSACENGSTGADFFEDIRKLYGETVANEYIDHMIKRANHG